MMKPRLVLCSDVQLPPDHPLREGRHVVRLDTLNPDSNTHLRIENLADAFKQHLEPRMIDLLELATYIYTADCEASRELAWMDDKSTEPWSREFHIVMPVRHLNFWKREDVQQSLASALNFLSSDRFTFDFVQLQPKRPVDGYLQFTPVDETPFHQIDRVTMFSGGLDSLAGAVESASKGERLVLVSHRPASQTNKRQVELAKQLKERFKVPILHIPVWVNKSGFDRESTQRTRSFLFAALGVAAASVLQAGGVRFYENGVCSLNWPLADEVKRSRAARTTHPEALQRMQQFFRLATEKVDFAIDNPFIFKTKTEIVSTLGKYGAGDLIVSSCSCTHTMFQPKTQWHCGRCGQCIDRRIAILAAGMEEYDTEDDYVTNVFTGKRTSNYDHNIAANYARYASELHRMTEQDIAVAYNLELTRAARCFPNAGGTAQRFLDMQKRHGAAVCGVLSDQVGKHQDAFISGNLDKASLLAMIGRGEHLESRSTDGTVTTSESFNTNYIFRKAGLNWTILYQTAEIQSLPELHGMAYIHYLLKQPHQPIRVDKLYHAVHGATSDIEHDLVTAELIPDSDGEQLTSIDISKPIDDDEQSLSQYREWLRGIEEEEAQAKRNKNSVELAEIQRRKTDLTKLISSEFGIGGTRRSLTDQYKKARQTVSKAINTAKDQIRRVNRPLAEHFDDTITTGTDCRYSPQSNITWNT